ncbi:MAG: periplasmic heavy metal sensor, partial [Rhodobacteraceae bacterium]|nr:periplasmic heavy metal sensor [Paracoccaceae bacterium]
ALILSLAVNLLVIGLAAGAFLRGHGMRDRAGMMGRDGLGLLAQSLPRADRRALREKFEAAAGPQAGRGAIRADMGELARLLRAESWDKGAAAAVLARQGARGAERLAKGQQIMLDYLAGLTPVQRKALADQMDHGLPPPASGE